MGWVLGVFVVFGWVPVKISLLIRFKGKSRVYEDENNTIEQPDACSMDENNTIEQPDTCSMDAISRGHFAWVWVGCS